MLCSNSNPGIALRSMQCLFWAKVALNVVLWQDNSPTQIPFLNCILVILHLKWCFGFVIMLHAVQCLVWPKFRKETLNLYGNFAVVSGEVSQDISHQLLDTLAEELVKMHSDAQKEVAQYAFMMIRPCNKNQVWCSCNLDPFELGSAYA